MAEVKEVFENGKYKMFDGDDILCVVEKLDNDIYRAKNLDCDITCQIAPIDDYTVSITTIDYKRRGKDGKYRKTTKLIDSNSKWLWYMLENLGWIEKRKCRA